MALHYRDAVWPEARPEPLFEESCIAVCSPEAAFARAASSGDFRRVPLLHLSNRPQAWAAWLDDAALARRPANALAGHRFDLFTTLVEGVRCGLGAAIVPTFFAQRELAEGSLVQAHRHVQQGTQAYAVFVPGQRAAEAGIAAFVDWVRAEVQAEAPIAGRR
ncbi:LysR substrate-binding domain-containing protein [Pseudacidovorax intermedius]|uniref:LysR substrate-binding domain-containing protein n=1 Tax=Pseudacidovorax intermedius TaxID=433924 RepID=UPI00187C9E0A|nr:LysR substrate-binding domain-containing protein [Pseudacidovorax intermedius]